MAEVTTESNRMAAVLPGYVIYDFRAALLVKIRITAIYSGGEGIEHLQVRLSRDRGKVKSPVAILHTQFIHQVRGEGRREASHKRLVAQVIVFKAGRQIESVIQR